MRSLAKRLIVFTDVKKINPPFSICVPLKNVLLNQMGHGTGTWHQLTESLDAAIAWWLPWATEDLLLPKWTRKRERWTMCETMPGTQPVDFPYPSCDRHSLLLSDPKMTAWSSSSCTKDEQKQQRTTPKCYQHKVILICSIHITFLITNIIYVVRHAAPMLVGR